MKKKVNVTVNGKVYQVEVEDVNASHLKVIVNGQDYIVTLDTQNISESQSTANLVPENPGIPKMTASVPTSSQQTVSSPNEIRAPMPGKISDISVKAGDKVVYKQLLCTLEAMKMKNAIRAGRDGVIVRVEVTDGQKVPYGQILFVLENPQNSV